MLPLNAYVVSPLFFIGILIALPCVKREFFSYFQNKSTPKLLFSFLLFSLFVIFIWWLASRSMVHPRNYDTGLYHFNSIRWLNSFPVVPGLGNLHGRLAFNQSHFTYIAALNFFPFFNHGWSIGNSFLLFLAFLTLFDMTRPALRKPSLFIQAHPFQYLSVILLIPIFIFETLFSYDTFSPSPDFPTIIVQLILIIALIQGIGNWANGKSNQHYRAKFLAVVSVIMITVKLSNLAFSFAIFLFFLTYAIVTKARSLALRTFLLSFTFLVVWSAHGYILSGTPLYPSTIGYISFDWSIPIEEVQYQKNVTYSYARQPHVHIDKVLGSWNWFQPWLKKHYKNLKFFLWSSLFFFIGALILLFYSKIKEKRGSTYLEWLILIPPLFGLLFWFFTAPDPRFSGGQFYILVICPALVFTSLVKNSVKGWPFLLVFSCVFALINYHNISLPIKKKEVVKYVSTGGWRSINTAPLAEKTTLSGLKVYVPTKNELNWDAPLPATPYFNPRLRLRKPDDLASGFTVRDQNGKKISPYPENYFHL